MALTAERNTKQQDNKPIVDLIGLPVKGSVKIYKGALVGRDAGGFLKPMAADLTLRCVGMALSTVDTTGLSDGAVTINVRQGVFKYANGDTIVVGLEGNDLYASDDQTVNKGDSNGTRPFVGKLVQVDTDGVWIEIRLTQASAGNGGGVYDHYTWSVVLDLADISAATMAKFTPAIASRIKKVQASVLKAATTGGKAATITPQVNAVAVTGGVLSLTSANMTPIANEVDGTAVVSDGKDIVPAGVALTLVASAVTAFVEGRVEITVEFG